MAKLKFSSLKELRNYVYNLCESAYPHDEVTSVQLYKESTADYETCRISVFIRKELSIDSPIVVKHSGKHEKDWNVCIKKLMKSLYPIPAVDKVSIEEEININTDEDED